MRKDHMRKKKKDHVIGGSEKENKEEIKDAIYSLITIVIMKIILKVTDIDSGVIHFIGNTLHFFSTPEKQKTNTFRLRNR